MVGLACINRTVYNRMDSRVGKQNFMKNTKNLELWITILFIIFSGFKNFYHVYMYIYFTFSYFLLSLLHFVEHALIRLRFQLVFPFRHWLCLLFTVRRRLDKCLMSLIVCAKCPNLNSLSSFKLKPPISSSFTTFLS